MRRPTLLIAKKFRAKGGVLDELENEEEDEDDA